MALQPARAPSAGARRSSSLAASSLLRVAPQLLVHSPLLEGCRLWAAAQQHGRGGKVLGHPPEEWRCVSVGVRASIGASIVVVLQRAQGRRRCAAARLVCSQTAFVPIAIPLMGLTLHRNVLRRVSIVVPLTGLALHRHSLCKLSLAWLGVHAELLV
jgi:hypothetical protein